MLTMSCSFFFSSRRRHTRLTCDWSSDVCSSDLEDGEPLEAEAVEQVEGEEAPQHGPRGGGEQARERERGGGEDERRAQRRPGAEPAGGDRPRALARMRAIVRAVAHVVESVGGARGEAEGGAGERGQAERARLAQAPGEDERGEHDGVLRPLARARQREQINEPGRAHERRRSTLRSFSGTAERWTERAPALSGWARNQS